MRIDPTWQTRPTDERKLEVEAHLVKRVTTFTESFYIPTDLVPDGLSPLDEEAFVKNLVKKGGLEPYDVQEEDRVYVSDIDTYDLYATYDRHVRARAQVVRTRACGEEPQ